MHSVKAGYSNRENFLFLFVTLLHLIPLFLVRIFPTLDGAAHVYNARVFAGLMGGDDFYEKFHQLNFFLLPNVLGHFLLAFLQIFSSPLISEKILQVVYVVTLVYSFRYLSTTIYSGRKITSYLSFILIYTFLFFLGFYNYCLSVSCMFFALGYYMRHQLGSWKERVVMAVLILLTFLGHIFSFVILFISIGVLILGSLVKSRQKEYGQLINRLLNLFYSTIPTLILLIIYLMKFGGSGPTDFVPLRFKLDELITGRFLIVFLEIVEKPYTSMVAGIVILMFIGSMIIGHIRRKIVLQNHNGFIISLTLVMFVVFLLAPDEFAAGEFITSRMELMIFSFMLLSGGICIHALGKRGWIVIIITLLLNSAVIYIKWPSIKKEGEVAYTFFEFSKHIPDKSVVLPLNHSTDWFMKHFNNYLGADRNLLILENYEAGRKYFPVLWKDGRNPVSTLGNLVAIDNCIDVPAFEKSAGTRIDYVVFYNWQQDRKDSCSVEKNKFLKLHFALIHEEEGMALLGRIGQPDSLKTH